MTELNLLKEWLKLEHDLKMSPLYIQHATSEEEKRKALSHKTSLKKALPYLRLN